MAVQMIETASLPMFILFIVILSYRTKVTLGQNLILFGRIVFGLLRFFSRLPRSPQPKPFKLCHSLSFALGWEEQKQNKDWFGRLPLMEVFSTEQNMLKVFTLHW